jgi:regulator of protease activity HflC (stomatin/prohibitin superfamily)
MMTEGGGFGFGAAISLFAVVLMGGGLYGCPQYNVWTAEMEGKAKFAKANQDREIEVRQSLAKKDASKNLADAEIERARGVAEANKIIGTSLKDNEAYLRWLWIESLKEGKDGNTVVYVPTEAGLPILESDRFGQMRKPAK